MRFRRHDKIAWTRWMTAAAVWTAGTALTSRADEVPTVPEPPGRTASNQSITIDLPDERPDATENTPGDGLSEQQATPADSDATADEAVGEGSRLRSPGLVRRSRSDVAVGGDHVAPSAFDSGSLVALGVVLLIVVVVFLFLRRLVPSLRHVDHTALQVVGRAAVSPKHHVALVRLGRRYVLIGVGGDRMSRLCEVSEPQEVAELTAHFGGALRSKSSAFSQLLAREAEEFDSDERETDARYREGDGQGGASDRTSPPEHDGERMPGLIRLRQRLRSLKTG